METVGTSEDINLQNLLTSLALVALDDGVITAEEKAILNQIKIDMQIFRDTIEQAEADGSITIEESKKLDEIKKQLLSNAYNITTNDHVISPDERKIMSKLIKILIHEKEEEVI
jgi:tellurite resistance protein